MKVTAEFTNEVNDVSMQEQNRQFIFAEFFAGMGGLSEAMRFMSGGRISVCATWDGYAGGWNILDEEDYKAATNLCATEIDHGHFAPPCRTLTRARRSDQFGQVPVLRSDKYPEGWGDQQTEQANEMIARMVVLCLLLHDRGATFSIENPWDSFLWLLKVMQRLVKLKESELVCLHQCAYGASSRKPTGILATSCWMKLVRRLCHEVRPHLHASVLSGKAWDYVEEKWVWRTSLAAEYPCGLCVSWAKALRCWLESKLGKRWLQQRPYKVVGRWKNVLVRASIERGGDSARLPQPKMTAKQVREQENKAAVGGLRHPRDAVRKSEELRRTGSRIRRVVEDHMTNDRIRAMCEDCTAGMSKEWILEVRRALGSGFGAEVTDSGLQADLSQKLLECAADKDACTLPQWMRHGFPLGIEEEIKNNGIFPATGVDSAAVEASRRDGLLQDDIDGAMTNYSSFEEAGEPAEELLRQMELANRADVVETWQQVEELTGGGAKLTRLACIVKLKENGEYKYRLVVDCRRSGVNGQSKVHERVILPKMTDAIASIQSLLEVRIATVPKSWSCFQQTSRMPFTCCHCVKRNANMWFTKMDGRNITCRRWLSLA